jgi:DNA polymerase sigma
MKKVKELLIQRVTNIVQGSYQNFIVDVYGSHSTGLCLHWSDIDLVIGPQESDNNARSHE